MGNRLRLDKATIHVQLAIDGGRVNLELEPLVWQLLGQSKNLDLEKMQFQPGSELLILRLDFDSGWRALYQPNQ